MERRFTADVIGYARPMEQEEAEIPATINSLERTPRLEGDAC
jgi:hypothetical protein